MLSVFPSDSYFLSHTDEADINLIKILFTMCLVGKYMSY